MRARDFLERKRYGCVLGLPQSGRDARKDFLRNARVLAHRDVLREARTRVPMVGSLERRGAYSVA